MSPKHACDELKEAGRRAPTLAGLLWRSAEDLYRLRPSLLLLFVFWPIAFSQMIRGCLQRIFYVGSIYQNVAHLVREGDAEATDPLLLQSAVSLARQIKDPNNPLTSETLVTLCIQQIKRVNPFLNAVVASRFEKALIEARAVDEAVREGRVPENSAFWGVPILVKECFELADMPYTAGLVGRKGVMGSITGPAVSAAERAGAVVLASTNVSEGCMWHESYNHVYGRTYNPYDLDRTCGGSSGGCGAGVASCMAPFAITSDVGGSTRIPAHYNGVFGHKPTGGTVCNDRCIPVVGDGAIKRYCQLGPTSKHAEDLWPLLCALSTSTGDSCPLATRGNPHAVEEVDIKSVKVYYSKHSLGGDYLLSKLHPLVGTRIEDVAAYLQLQGSDVAEFPQEEMPEMFQLLNCFMMWSTLMHEAKHEDFKVSVREGKSPFSGVLHILWDSLLSVFEVSGHTFPALLLCLLEYTGDWQPQQKSQLRTLARKIKEKLEALLAGDKVWILPALPTPAPVHNESLLRIFDTSNTSFFNVMELPVTVIPVGLTDERGLPVGLQIVGGRGQDHVCIAVAKALQEGKIASWNAPRPIKF